MWDLWWYLQYSNSHNCSRLFFASCGLTTVKQANVWNMKHNLVSLRINSTLIPRPNCCDTRCLRMRAKWWLKTWYLKHFSVCLKGLRHGYLDYFVRFPLLTGKIRVLIKQICLTTVISNVTNRKKLTNFGKTRLQSRLFFLEFGHPMPYSVLAQLLTASSLAVSSYFHVSPYWVSVLLVWSLKNFVTQPLKATSQYFRHQNRLVMERNAPDILCVNNL